MELNYSWQRIAESYCGNGGGTNVYIRLYGKLNSQDVNTNKTSYSLQCRVYFDKHLKTSSITSNIDGTPGSYSGTLDVTNQEVTLQEVSREHTHNNDGTSGNISKGCSWASVYSSVNGSTSGTFTLPRINRQANITSANNFNDEENPSMKFNNPAGFTMNVWLEPNPNGEHLCVRNNIANTGTYTWELTEEERNQLRAKCTGNSCTVRYGIYTIIGGSSYASYVDKTMTIVNGNPIFTDFIYKDTNTNITAITEDNQILVKGLSTLQATIPVANKMEALKQATPKNYVATIDTINQSINYDDENDIIFNLGGINTAGTQRLNIRAYDSRNNSTLVYKDIIVYDYAKPVINFTAERLNNFEDQTTLKISGSFSSLNIDNVEKNTIQSVQYRYKEKSSETWGNWINTSFTLNNNEFNCSDVIIALDNTEEFDIEVKVTDNLSNNNTTTSIDVGKSIFFISSNEKKCYVYDKRVLTVGEEESYASDETVIGTWINGKPLYRQVLDVTLTPNSTNNFTVTNSSNFEVVTKVDGITRITRPNGWVPVNFYNDNQHNFAFFNLDNNRLELGNSWYANRAIIIIEYTKITD